MRARIMNLKAFPSRRVVTPHGIEAAAVLVEDGRILDVVPPVRGPEKISVKDFGEAAILPGLVYSHVHINEPGRTEWEGFRTPTRAAAAGGGRPRGGLRLKGCAWVARRGSASVCHSVHVRNLPRIALPAARCRSGDEPRSGHVARREVGRLACEC